MRWKGPGKSHLKETWGGHGKYIYLIQTIYIVITDNKKI